MSNIGSFGRRYVLNTDRWPGPPTHDAPRSPRKVISMFIAHHWSFSGGVVPGWSGVGEAMHPVESQCRRGSPLLATYSSAPAPSSASETNIVLERPLVTSA